MLHPTIAPLSTSHFYFTDSPSAIRERDGLTAKACEGRLRRHLRRKALERKRREKEDRRAKYDGLTAFYRENAEREISPFSDADVANRLAELLARGAMNRNSFIQY